MIANLIFVPGHSQSDTVRHGGVHGVFELFLGVPGVSSSDFRHIAISNDTQKAERLFRAAVSAFCSLPRPSRREIAQLEDLVLPLFEAVSTEALRFVAAALSETEYAPHELVRRLCDAPIDVAAPLLIRSRCLTDIDLIALIGRHGLPHARAIARRSDLNRTIADLVRALEGPTRTVSTASPEAPSNSREVADSPPRSTRNQATGQAAEGVRHHLRTIMAAEQQRQAGLVDSRHRPGLYAKLRETALTGNAAFFQTALADALEVDFTTARLLVKSSDYSGLLTALRALDLSEDQAFLIAVAAFPSLFPHPQAIRIFLDRFRLLHRDLALERMRE